MEIVLKGIKKEKRRTGFERKVDLYDINNVF